MKKVNFSSLFVGVMFLFGITINSYAQISQGGTPPSFSAPSVSDDFEIREFPKPDIEKVRVEDGEDEKNGKPYRFGVSVPVNLNIENSGTWTDLPDGGRIWRLKLKSQNALALTVCFDEYWLSPGGKLYLYNEDKTQVIGGFTEFNNHESGLFSTEFIKGETVTLEYYEQGVKFNKGNRTVKLPRAKISISEIAYAYRGFGTFFKGVGDSDTCEVDIICSPEGDNWLDEKRGVALASIKNGSNWFSCSGSLINNTAEDCSPYFLLADHCAYNSGYASAADLLEWMFYFGFDAPTCGGSASSAYFTNGGCTKKANSGDYGAGGGSDFFLVLLNYSIPDGWNPYYNGWNRGTSASSSGVSIHHPAADNKKISTYTSTLSNYTTHWQVNGWTATANGRGVTEGGSSGSPIFDNNGRIVGTLTGGSSFCDTPTEPDYYGKFSYHWLSNGATDAEQLKPWLDPDPGTGATTLDGTNQPCGGVIADFTADITTVSESGYVNFTDQSTGSITTWNWTFEQGSPSSFNGQNPPSIQYNNAGTWDVTLYVSDGTNNDTEIKTNYITVTSGTTSSFTLDFEASADWATTFDPWTINDVDGADVYGSVDVDFPNEGQPMAFMAFNPSQTTPPWTGSMTAHGGVRFGASFSAISPNNPSNDWLISPQLTLGTSSSITLWVKTLTDEWGLERYNIAVSTTNNNPASFTVISGSPYQTAPVANWTEVNYDLTAYDNQTVYIGIQCVSDDAFIFMIDDISINTNLVGSDEILSNNFVNIYPNPANDFININFNSELTSKARIVIYNILGETMALIEENNISSETLKIDVSNYPSGIYYLNVQADNKVLYSKISVVK